MIISRVWLNEFINLQQISTQTLCEKLNSIGLEVDDVKTINIPNKIVVAKVTQCKDHEDSDHLHVCQVDTGNELLQIVCGAPNVAEGQFVACALVGAVMPNGLEIKKAKLRGVESSGMLCSSSELGLPKINDGIMILDESIGELVLGKELKQYDFFKDDLIEIELTPNRGDCLSINGISRDLSAVFNLELNKINTFQDDGKNIGIGRILSIHVQNNTQDSLLYKAIELQEPLKLDLKTKLRLAFADIKLNNPVRNLLDYATYATGVIFNAYDYHKISTQDNQELVFNIDGSLEKSAKIYVKDQYISSIGIGQDEKFIADQNSKIIIIEANYSNPENVLNSINSDKNHAKNDMIIYNSTRGSEPNLAFGINFLLNILTLDETLIVYNGHQQILNETQSPDISFKISEISKIIGFEVDKEEVLLILKRLGFDNKIKDDIIYSKVPLFRHDIKNIQDIAEEILRIIGIDKIKSVALNISQDSNFNQTYYDYKNALKLRKKAVSNGFYECVHYIFDNIEELKELNYKPCKIKILNPLSNELGELRPTLINHLLASCEQNIKNYKKSVKLFEYGDVFDENGVQSKKISFLSSGLLKEISLLNGTKPINNNFFAFANLIQSIIGKIELKKGKLIPFLSEFEQAEVYFKNVKIGFMGRIDLRLEKQRDLEATYVCELDFEKIIFHEANAHEYSKFPSITRDLSFLVPKNLEYEKIKNCIKKLDIKILKDFAPVDIYDLGENMSLTLKFTFQGFEKTLQDDEITIFIDQILSSLKVNLNIGLR